MNEFCHLHAHSTYSVMDAISPIEGMVLKAKEIGYKSLALTDHGTMAGSYEFYKTCRKHGINPIIGVEFYCARNTIGEGRNANNPTDHLLVLAKNEIGFQNLLKLATKSSTDGFHYTPRVDLEMLSQHNEGLICSSACLSGALSKISLGSKVYDASARAHIEIPGDINKAIAYAAKMRDVFEPGNFFLEVMLHEASDQSVIGECRCENYNDMIGRQKQTIEAIYTIARNLELPVVATNDVHMINQSDFEAKDTIFAIRTGEIKGDPSRKLTVSSDAFYLKTEAEMCHIFRDHPDAIKNTMFIAEQCNIELESTGNHIPVFDTGKEDTIAYWRRSIKEGFEKKYSGKPIEAAALERVQHEINVIETMGFVSYFLMVADFIHFARNNGVPVGPGRGSAAGSIVSYCLDITAICPLHHGLLFERFLNSERVSLPDIDIDFCKENVYKVYAYAQEKYGADSVARIATFGSLWAKSAIREVGKAHGLPKDEITLVAGSIHDGQGEFKAWISDEIADGSENEIIREYYNSYAAWRQVIDEAIVLEGCKRSVGKHAAGFVVGDKDLSQYIPLARATKKSVSKVKDSEDAKSTIDVESTMLFTQYPMDDLEELGLIKMDFLALETLTVIERAIKMINSKHNLAITEEWIRNSTDLGDPNVYKFLCSGQLMGIFQCESQGLRHLLMQIAPNQFPDIVAAVALYRPGPMDYKDPLTGMSMLEMYVFNRNKKRDDPTYHWLVADPSIAGILDETYGIIVYQEQIMQICQIICGYTLNDADRFRKAVGKKKPELVAKEKVGFVAAAQQVGGLAPNVANDLFESISAFARYGFNKTVAAGTQVLTKAGLKSIEDVNHNDQTLTMLADGSTIWTNVVECHDHGIVPIFEVTFNDGTSVDCTPDHKFLTKEGQVPIHEICERQDLLVWGTVSHNETISKSSKNMSKSQGNSSSKQNESKWSQPKEGSRSSSRAPQERSTSLATTTSKCSTQGYEVSGSTCYSEEDYDQVECISRGSKSSLRYSQDNQCSEGHSSSTSASIEGMAKDSSKGVCGDYSESCSIAKEVQNGDGIGTNHSIGRLHPEYSDIIRRISQTNRLHQQESEDNSRSRRSMALSSHQRGRGPKESSVSGSTTGLLSNQRGLDSNPFIHAMLQDEWSADSGYRPSIEGSESASEQDTVFRRPVRVRFLGMEQGYDLEVDHADHNYILGNGLCNSNSHAAAYGVLTYVTAWLKTYYPTEFMAATLTSGAMKSDVKDQRKYIEDASMLGIVVEAPDINKSVMNFVPLADFRIMAGLMMIKGISKLGSKIIAERNQNGPYVDFSAALTRLVGIGVNKGAMGHLIDSGAMDSFGHSRPAMVATIERFMPMISKQKKRTNEYTSILNDDSVHVQLLAGEPVSAEAEKTKAIEMLGVYIVPEQ